MIPLPSPHDRLLDGLFNRLFAIPQREGELDFLAGRSVLLRHATLPVGLRIEREQTPLGARLRVRRHSPFSAARADLTIRAPLAGYLHLIARDRDADTLFFQRVLCMEGDTDLGLRVKNLLDGLDLDDVPLGAQLQRAGTRLLRLLDALRRPPTPRTVG
ncbi:MAG: SCP2 sterol-binding domain-containing protein [Chromatiales bacterium]|nr:SCP2 sterol-binding domain-containing protein [Gammaproteobacteria bacterium]MCP5352963.1 SCP2 sterol-binding domain-containing protein [Chromatiales bacterium]